MNGIWGSRAKPQAAARPVDPLPSVCSHPGLFDVPLANMRGRIAEDHRHTGRKLRGTEGEMSASRDAGPLSRLRPLAAALVLAGFSGPLHAVTDYRPGELQAPADPILREDGTPLRVALGEWHADALKSAVPPAATTTIRPVTNCNDDGPGSLRAVLAATASGDTIDLSGLACSRISLETGALAAHVDTVTIEGPARRLTIDGNDRDRVMLHYGAGTMTLRNLVITHGSVVADGTDLGIAGCIASAGYLTLDHSKVTDCFASGEGGYGGAIYAYSLILFDSTLSDSVAYGTHPTNGTAAFGGGAFVYQIDLVGSTVTGNSASHRSNPPRTSYDIGGGISTVRGGLVVDSTIDSNYATTVGGGLATFTDILVRNSTISGNVARTFGGGGLFVRFRAVLDARNSTITDNEGHNGGGILTNSPALSLVSTIVAGNHADPHETADLVGLRDIAVTGSASLVGIASDNLALPADTLRGDPGLMPLGYNGGQTRTHALRATSPAIDAGNNVSQLVSDQRGAGYPRVVGAAADIGAFEYRPTSPAGSDPLDVPALTGWATTLLFGFLAWIGARNAASRDRKRTSHARCDVGSRSS
jgi:hypothetical protein